jgi:GrpB-like predicted nucleotidyltransferase (UPF0157 family)
VLALEHIGSTSVPDLAAKPIIDIDLTVSDASDESAYVPPLESLGFVLTIREARWHQHRGCNLRKQPGVRDILDRIFRTHGML